MHFAMLCYAQVVFETTASLLPEPEFQEFVYSVHELYGPSYRALFHNPTELD